MSTLTIQKIKKIIEKTEPEFNQFEKKAKVGERYYLSKNDILTKAMPQEDSDNPRNSNNRIPSGLYHLLVEQKWSFMFKNGVKFLTNYKEENTLEDIVHYNSSEHEHKETNKGRLLDKEILKKLGNNFMPEVRSLCINASNTGRAWLHYWKTGSHLGVDKDTGEFKYASIDPKEIHAEWGNTVNRELLWLLRHYIYLNPEDGEEYDVYEYWDKEFCYTFQKKVKGTVKHGLRPYSRFFYRSTDTGEYERTHVYKHGFDRVPFICFRNNELETSDLDPIKKLIDAYDLVNSQYVNDEEDFQKMIFILTGYGAEPADDFLQQLKKSKLVKLESAYPEKGLQPKLETLAIEIPYEAYKESMDASKKAIYEQGMGLDVTDDELNYTSGEALAFKYSLLELKCAATKIQFEKGFTILVKELAKHLGYDIDETLVETRWNDGKIRNETDLTNNSRLCLGLTSLRTALKVNPYVDDVDEEIKLIEREKQEEMKMEIPLMNNTRSTYTTYNSYNRQSDYQLNRSESEIKAKEPEKYTQSQKANNQTQVRK